MNRTEFIKEIAKRKGISYEKAYTYVNSVMDTIRIVLMQNQEIEIGGFGTFDMVTDLKGNRMPVFHAGEALKRTINTFNK